MAQTTEAPHDEGFSRLLAAIFTRVAVPVAILAADGRFTLANPAFYHLFDVSVAQLATMRAQDIIPAKFSTLARAAQEKQLKDGERYDLTLDVIAQGGVHAPVRLTSMLLRDGDKRYRVVTLVPIEAAGQAIVASTPPTRNIGELRAISLAAFRAIFGENWKRIALRAMLKAEQILRRNLEAEDVLSRCDDHSFMVWFDSADTTRNERVLASCVREIRLRFLADFGEEAANYVKAVIVPGTRGSAEGTKASAVPLPSRNLFEAMLADKQKGRTTV